MLPIAQNPPPAVYIVGAGPGDPELITRLGYRLLQAATVIVYTDSLIPNQMLADLDPTVEIIGSADKSLEEILAILIDRVRSNHVVVRLHDGDPSLYGAIQEQMMGLLAANISFEVIPGVSAYQLAAARLRVELTLPEQVQSIILTRMSGRIQMPSHQDLASLAAHQASLGLYLSAKNISAAQTQLLQHYPVDMPVAICYRLGWLDERIEVCSLAHLAQTSQALGFTRTVLYLISPALRLPTVPVGYRSLQTAPTGELQSASPSETVVSNLYAADYDRLFRPLP
jgi:precorrin-4/cobalt-precorrin-4 C11-methyltransferase